MQIFLYVSKERYTRLVFCRCRKKCKKAKDTEGHGAENVGVSLSQWIRDEDIRRTNHRFCTKNNCVQRDVHTDSSIGGQERQREYYRKDGWMVLENKRVGFTGPRQECMEKERPTSKQWINKS